MSDVDLRQLAVDRNERNSPRHTRRHLLTRYVLPAALIIGFVSLVVWASWDVMFPPKLVTVAPVLATQAEVRQEGTPLFQAAGWVEPRPTPIRIAALAPGVVEQLLVVENQAVKAGEPIAELVKDDARLAYDRSIADQRLREAELAEAQAALTAAQTRLDQPVHLEAAVAESEADLAKIETMLTNLPFQTRRAQSDLRFAKNEYDRNLAAKDAVAKREIDEAQTLMQSTQAYLDELVDRENALRNEATALGQRSKALKTQLELLADEIRARDEAAAKVDAAAARVQQARVAVAEAKLRLDRMTIRSPIDGRIYRLVGHPGARVGGELTGDMTKFDASTVVTLYRPDMLQVRVDVRFEDIPKVSLGQAVQIDNAALPEPCSGRVLYVSSEADIQKNTLQVKVAIDSPPSVFKPEMLVDATFLAPEQLTQTTAAGTEMRLYVPQTLVHQDSAGPYVWLADQSARVAWKTPVTTGIVGTGGLIEITNGLSISSRIIVTGIQDLKHGDRIRVIGEAN